MTEPFHRRASKVSETSEPSPTADPKLLDIVDDIFKSGKSNNPYLTIPTHPSQALEADRMLMSWKEQAKPWDIILKRWVELSSRQMDVDNLSCRHFLIQENYANSTGQWDKKILTAKEIARQTTGGDLWERVQQVMLENFKVYLRDGVCQRRFWRLEMERMEREGVDPDAVKVRAEESKDEDDFWDDGAEDVVEGAAMEKENVSDDEEDEFWVD